MQKFFVFLLIVWSTGISSWSQQRLDYTHYQLVFEENFDSIRSIEELTDVWQFQHDDPGFGWGDYYDSATQILHPAEYYDKRMVSLRKGGYLRLSAKRVKGRDSIYSSWRQGYRKPMYKSGMIQMRLDLQGPPFDHLNGRSGFLYGMFEIRVRLPKGNDNFAAFWLTRADAPTEIDIFEYGERYRQITNNVIERFPVNRSRFTIYDVPEGTDLDYDFQVITAVWTPQAVSFFMNGLLTSHVPYSEIKTFNGHVLSLVANLGMRPYFSVRKQKMDIDYIRVYKPKGGDYALPYMLPSPRVLE